VAKHRTQKHEQHPRHREAAQKRERRADGCVARRGELREDEAEPAERRDERGDDGGTENGDARRITAVRARFHVAAASVHVPAMPEEMPKQHAGQREHQSHHQAKSVDNHKSSLIRLFVRLKMQSRRNASGKADLISPGSSCSRLIKHQNRRRRSYNLAQILESPRPGGLRPRLRVVIGPSIALPSGK